MQSAPSLDHDTKDEPGTPHIADTIQKKIKRCGAFVADLTSVVSYKAADGRKKQTPNPNVLIELGLAIRSRGWERIVLVMNDAFGSLDHLPFDLKHHSFPITYTLSELSDRKAVEDKLADRLAEKLKLILRADAGRQDGRRGQVLENAKKRAEEFRQKIETEIV